MSIIEMPDENLKRLSFVLDQVPSFLRPSPSNGFLTRDKELCLNFFLTAKAPGCMEIIDGISLKVGQMGHADDYEGRLVPSNAKISIKGWIEKSDGDFRLGDFLYKGYVTEARVKFSNPIAKKCIVRCASGPQMWPPLYRAPLKTSDYSLHISRDPSKKENFRCVNIEIESTTSLNETIVRDILTAMSFVSGRRIADYEMEFLDESGDAALIISYQPHIYSKSEYTLESRNPIQNSPYLKPTDINEWSNLLELVVNFNKLVPLRNILINVWFGRPLALGGNLIFYSAALESLVNSWFQIPDNKLSADRILESEFKKVIRNVVDQIKHLELENFKWSKVREAIEKSNKYSGISKFIRFYEIHGLKVGRVEDEIQKVRNQFAHGADFTIQEDELLFALTNAGEALINRILLKLMGYDGRYVDYSTYDFPLRQLSDPLGGPNGNGDPNP